MIPCSLRKPTPALAFMATDSVILAPYHAVLAHDRQLDEIRAVMIGG
jgi:hypothetical protein